MEGPGIEIVLSYVFGVMALIMFFISCISFFRTEYPGKIRRAIQSKKYMEISCNYGGSGDFYKGYSREMRSMEKEVVAKQENDRQQKERAMEVVRMKMVSDEDLTEMLEEKHNVQANGYTEMII